MHSSNELKQRKYFKGENLTADVFRPQLGFAVNPFAPSFDHERPVFVGMTRDGQKDSSPLVSHTQRPRGRLRCASTCRTLYYNMVCSGWQSKNTNVLLLQPNYLANKRRRETLLSPLLIFGQRKEERWLGFLVLSHKNLLGISHNCAEILLPP